MTHQQPSTSGTPYSMAGRIQSPRQLRTPYLYSRAGNFYVRVPIPKNLRAFFSDDGKRKFLVHWLKTKDEDTAKRLAGGVVSDVKQAFHEARKHSVLDHAAMQRLKTEELHRVHARLAANFADIREKLPAITSTIGRLANPIEDLIGSPNPVLAGTERGMTTFDYTRRVLLRMGVPEPSEETILAVRAVLLQAQSMAVATVAAGESLPALPPRAAIPTAQAAAVPFADDLEAWLGGLKLVPKSRDLRRANIIAFAAEFPAPSSISKRAVQHWIEQQEKNGRKAETIRRQLSDVRLWWQRLVLDERASDDGRPFDGLIIQREHKGNGNGGRKTFAPEQVAALVAAAEAGDDQPLADLIRAASYSGARREEICSLRVADVSEARDAFKITDAKTPSGVRVVPIHSKLKATIERLARDSADGYLLPLKADRYGDRGVYIGHRFSALKTAAGFDGSLVFHSLRHGVITLLIQAGAPTETVAHIVGHKVPNMTGGHYYAGPSMAMKAAAIELLSYPELG